MAKGLTAEGLLPALKIRNRVPAISRSKPSAICERAELPVQRISTCSFMIASLLSVEICCTNQFGTNHHAIDYISRSLSGRHTQQSAEESAEIAFQVHFRHRHGD